MSDSLPQSDVQTSASRPAVVWGAGILSLLTAVACTVLYAMSWRYYWSYLSADFKVALVLLSKLSFLWLLGLGLFRRWRWSRWAACVGFVFLAGQSCWNAFEKPRATPTADLLGVDPSEPGYPEGYVIFSFIFSTLFLAVAILFAFQPKVKRYFKVN